MDSTKVYINVVLLLSLFTTRIDLQFKVFTKCAWELYELKVSPTTLI